MTKISLRVYNREIEAFIESGQVDEAIAHCQHILKTFPMHLETYRLLGKGYLETRRYVDAADIFQRVLMSVPEDFVSHVGMSIIRDDENKLDEAIWHMERAFEVQPSNPAIQDELRKLYGRRDGVQPPKVRLTRDALANMYAQGALYSQAIAEIRAVLADDPNRPDLQVMLARAYSKDGRKKQAIEICTEQLKKYPYCFDALRILIDLMPPSDQLEFIQTYRLRVRALDPYSGFVTGSIFNSDGVPDTAVTLELLDYDPNSVERGSQPAWASSLGIKLEPEKKNLDVSELLSEKSNGIETTAVEEELPSSMEGEQEVTPEIEGVPDWMRSSGWEKTTEHVSENSIFEETEPEKEEPLARAEIPEWLKEMAPDEETIDSTKLPDGFEAMLEENSINSPVKEKILDEEDGSGPQESLMENELTDDNIPDWLKEDDFIEPTRAETESTESFLNMNSNQEAFNTPGSDDDQGKRNDISSQSADDISSWLGDVSQDEIKGGDELNGIRNNEDDLPEWLKDIGSEKPVEDLEIIDNPISVTENQSDEISYSGDLVESEMEGSIVNELPDWLREIESTQDLISSNDELVSEPEVEAEFSSIHVEEKNSTELPESTLESEGMEFKEEMDIPGNEINNLKIEPEGGAFNSNDDQDAAIAWLESLAEEQGVNSEELLTNPEERLKEPPDWVRNSIGEELNYVGDELINSQLSDPLLIENAKPSDNKSVNEETMELELSDLEEKSQELESIDQVEFTEDKDIASSFTDEIAEVSAEEQEWDSSSVEIPDSIGEPSNLVEEVTLDEGSLTEVSINQKIEETNESEIENSAESDISNWLSDLEASDSKISEELISPKVSEFYGNEVSEPLPDWLKDMEKGTSTSDWISESETSSDQKTMDNISPELLSEEKDIDDIGEIFPTDTGNWNLENAESESQLEPFSEEANPVASGDWQPIQPGETIPAEERTDADETDSGSNQEKSIHGGKRTGIGLLSKIPSRDIEKEAGTLEQAQSFIESGEIKKAMEVYAKLVKKGQLLEGVIHDLRETTFRYPVEIGIWQLLGDAYMRANRLQDALDAYTKAEELLR